MLSLKNRLTQSQLETLVENLPPSIMAVVFGIIVMFLVFYGVVDTWLLVSWTAVASLVVVCRYAVFLWARARIHDERVFPVIERLIILSATATGIVWGVASIIFSISSDMFYWVFLAFFMSGFVSGAIFSSSALLPAALGYFFPTILPITAWFFFQDDSRALLMGVLLLVFAIAAWKMIKNAHSFIVDKVEAQLQYQLAQQELQAKDEKILALQTMANGISHDFNNTLASIVGSIYLAKREPTTSDLLQKQLDRIEAGVSKATALGKKMLEFSDMGLLSREDLHVEGIVQKILDSFTPEKRKYLSLRHEGDLPILVGDAKQFETMVHELIINALESYDNEIGDVFISISQLHKAECPVELLAWESLHGDTCIRIDVQDYGCGMEAQTIDKIFDPFFTTKFTGRGLGLSTAYGIVRRMGGNITIDSNMENGTVVSVYLPS